LYAGTFFLSRYFEKKANKGLKRSLWIKLPRRDAIVAMVLIGMVTFGLILSVSTTSAKPSDFEGMNAAEIRVYLRDKGVPPQHVNMATDRIISFGANKSRSEKYLVQFSTMFTGERVLFQSRNSGIFGFGAPDTSTSEDSNTVINNPGGGSGGGRMVIRGEDGERVEMNLGDINGTLSDIPFVNTLAMIIVVLNSMLIVGIIGFGIYSVVKMKKSLETKKYDEVKAEK
jgi:hypothetical protein